MRIDLASVRAGSKTGPRLARRGRRLWRWLWPPLLFALGVLLPLVAADQIDAFMARRGHRPGAARLPALSAWASSLAEVEAADLPLLQLDLKFKRWQKLLDKRAEALQAGRLTVSKADFVSGTIRCGDSATPVVVRLQGSDVGQLQGEKWPLRVLARRGGHVLEIERFTLRSPRLDGVLTKAALYEHMRLAGVAAPRHRFVRLSINGTPRGVMAMEEYFSNELVAAQRRPEGPVLRFGKALLHASESLAADNDDLEPEVLGMGALDNYRLAPVRVFRAGRLLRDPPMRALVHRAVSLLDGFAAGRLSAEEVFDVEIMARFLAVCEVWGAAELLAWPNLRLYYNPLSDRLEPIAYASTTVGRRDGYALTQQGPFTRDLLGSAAMRAAFVRAMERESGAVAQGERLGRLRENVATWRGQIAAEYPMAMMDLDALAARARALQLAESSRPTTLLARRRVGPRGRAAAGREVRDELRLANPLMVDVEVLAARWRIPTAAPTATPSAKARAKKRDSDDGDDVAASAVEGPPRYAAVRWSRPVDLPLALSSTALDGPPRWHLLGVVREPGLSEDAEIELQARVRGSTGSSSTLSAPDFAETPGSVTAVTSSLPSWLPPPQPDTRAIHLRAGTYAVDVPTRLPPGQALHLEAGATLVFSPGAGLMVLGPLTVEGTAQQPVTLRFQAPVRGSAAPSPAGALVVVGGAQARVSHLQIVGPGGKREPERSGAGALVLYQTDLVVRDCEISGSTAPAALRVVRGTVDIAGLTVRGAAGDGLVLEFSRGSLRASHFAGIGGDAVDLAGTVLEVGSLQVSDAGDKALSAGERSRLKVVDLRVQGAQIGVAIKDSSDARIERADITATQAGIAAFTKKRRFGPAQVSARGVKVHGARVPFLVQGDSVLEVDGAPVPVSTITVRDLHAGPDPAPAP